MEGYIKKIEEQDDTTVLTVHILTPKNYNKQFEEYEAEIKAFEHLHIGLIEVKQDE